MPVATDWVDDESPEQPAVTAAAAPPARAVVRKVRLLSAMRQAYAAGLSPSTPSTVARFSESCARVVFIFVMSAAVSALNGL